MMELIMGIITTYSFVQVIIIICILFLFQVIYMKLTDDDYYSDLRDIKSKYKARMWAYLAGELKVIEAINLNRAETILGVMETCPTECTECENTVCKRTQFTMFGLILERTLHGQLFESLKNAIRLNGFHELNDDELMVYVSDKSDVILRDMRKSINQQITHYPSLRGTDDQQFSLEESQKFLLKIVKKSIKLQQQEKEERKKLKKKYSLWTQINIIGKMINKLKNNNDE